MLTSIGRDGPDDAAGGADAADGSPEGAAAGVAAGAAGAEDAGGGGGGGGTRGLTCWARAICALDSSRIPKAMNAGRFMVYAD